MIIMSQAFSAVFFIVNYLDMHFNLMFGTMMIRLPPAVIYSRPKSICPLPHARLPADGEAVPWRREGDEDHCEYWFEKCVLKIDNCEFVFHLRVATMNASAIKSILDLNGILSKKSSTLEYFITFPSTRTSWFIMDLSTVHVYFVDI